MDKGVALSISVTTRKMRPGEKDGRDYHFVESQANSMRLVEKNDLLEWAEVFDNYLRHTEKGGDGFCLRPAVMFCSTWTGRAHSNCATKRRMISSASSFCHHRSPELERRLQTRAQDDYETIHRRMAKAADEMSHWAGV